MYFDGFGSPKTVFRQRGRGTPCRHAAVAHKQRAWIKAMLSAYEIVDSNDGGLACRAAFKAKHLRGDPPAA